VASAKRCISVVPDNVREPQILTTVTETGFDMGRTEYNTSENFKANIHKYLLDKVKLYVWNGLTHRERVTIEKTKGLKPNQQRAMIMSDLVSSMFRPVITRRDIRLLSEPWVEQRSIYEDLLQGLCDE
jgi:hypothetical protein